MAHQDNGWERSAAAWIADMGDAGDFSRAHVLDAPMLARIRAGKFQTALDIGSGEGRFCRILRGMGISATGLEPTPSLRAEAQSRDPDGSYVEGFAEALPFASETFDLVVSYLTLIDIDGYEAAIAEMARVLKPDGRLLIANLNSFSTAGEWRRQSDGEPYFRMDDYATARAEWVSWRGISIRNWHRPMSDYMGQLIGAGLRLTHFDEPKPSGGPQRQTERYARVPLFHIMEWAKA